MKSIIVTSGALSVSVNHPSMRGVMPHTAAGRSALLSFRFRGPTETRSQLRSGEERHQVGIKLLAEDGDNLVYAMWTWQTGLPRVWVTEKVGGVYTNAVPWMTREVRSPTVGAAYQLAARIDGRVVQVWLGGEICWVGHVSEDAAGLGGPIGLRTDNAALDDIVLAEGPSL